MTTSTLDILALLSRLDKRRVVVSRQLFKDGTINDVTMPDDDSLLAARVIRELVEARERLIEALDQAECRAEAAEDYGVDDG